MRPRERESDLPQVPQRDGDRVGTRTQACSFSVHACGPGASSPSVRTTSSRDPCPPAEASQRAPGGGSPSLPLTQASGMAQGLHPQPAAGAGDTPSPSPDAWASGATPKIAQLSGPQIRLLPPCPDGAPGRAGSTPPRPASTCSPLSRQRLGPALNHSFPLENQPLLESVGDPSDGNVVSR